MHFRQKVLAAFEDMHLKGPQAYAAPRRIRVGNILGVLDVECGKKKGCVWCVACRGLRESSLEAFNKNGGLFRAVSAECTQTAKPRGDGVSKRGFAGDGVLLTESHKLPKLACFGISSVKSIPTCESLMLVNLATISYVTNDQSKIGIHSRAEAIIATINHLPLSAGVIATTCRQMDMKQTFLKLSEVTRKHPF